MAVALITGSHYIWIEITPGVFFTIIFYVQLNSHGFKGLYIPWRCYQYLKAVCPHAAPPFLFFHLFSVYSHQKSGSGGKDHTSSFHFTVCIYSSYVICFSQLPGRRPSGLLAPRTVWCLRGLLKSLWQRRRWKSYQAVYQSFKMKGHARLFTTHSLTSMRKPQQVTPADFQFCPVFCLLPLGSSIACF